MHPVAEQFHSLYWHSNTWRWTFWQGVPTLKCPLDLWIYQELLWLVRPQLIVELGTWAGGSAFFMAQMLDLMDADSDSQVVTVDILDSDQFQPHVESYAAAAPFPVRIRPEHPRITYLHGSSTDPAIVEKVHNVASSKKSVLVFADSDHSTEHTYNELALYHDLVTPDSWFVMEDTDGDGPRQAVRKFLAEHPEFYADDQCEKFFMTFNPGGYLRRRS
ncbi:MAG TPA: CmcI family methyltransferase [Thermoanaerobaculia bacterium]|nr:CmcI family methyltransferase [Thermoanaerobaculia bacterium]